MNHKEFATELAKRIGRNSKETNALIGALIDEMSEHWTDGDAISVQSFGTFEVKKKAERVSVNPHTKQRMLIPPRLVLTFKPSPLLKEKCNQKS